MNSRVVVSRVAVVGLMVGAALLGRPLLHAQEAEKGASLMAEARKAIGGEERLRGVKTVQTSGKFKRSTGNNTLEGDFEVFIELPSKYRRNETTGNAGGPIGERIEVMNGTDTWQETSNGFPAGRGGFGGFGGGRGDGGGRGRFGAGGPPDGAPGGAPGAGDRAGAPPIDPERLRQAQLRQRQTEMARLMLMWFLTTDAPVAWVGTAQSPDGTADVIEVKPAEGAATRVFLDSATHMPLMMTTAGFGGGGGRGRGAGADGRGADGRGQAPAGDQPVAPPQGPEADARRGGGRGGPPQQITIETHLSEYKAVGGIKLPHLITRGVNGQINEEWEIKNYRINPNLKSNTFSK